jgi:hypothetical protein
VSRTRGQWGKLKGAGHGQTAVAAADAAADAADAATGKRSTPTPRRPGATGATGAGGWASSPACAGGANPLASPGAGTHRAAESGRAAENSCTVSIEVLPNGRDVCEPTPAQAQAQGQARLLAAERAAEQARLRQVRTRFPTCV